jgi:GTPase SAR1 family protein
MAFDRYKIGLDVDGRSIELTLWYIIAHEDHDRLRPLFYPNAAVVVLAFAIDDRESFQSVSERWIPEILHFRATPKPPILHLWQSGTKQKCPRSLR